MVHTGFHTVNPVSKVCLFNLKNIPWKNMKGMVCFELKKPEHRYFNYHCVQQKLTQHSRRL